MVLILFVIMLLNLGTAARKRYTQGIVWSALASLMVLVNVIFFLKRGRVTGAEGDVTAFMVESVGTYRINRQDDCSPSSYCPLKLPPSSCWWLSSVR